MRKTKIILLLSFLFLSAALGFAANDVKVIVNDQELYMDTSPVIEAGRTLVPMRAIFEALGQEVIWHPDSQEVETSFKGRPIVLKIGDKRVNNKGVIESLDVAPKVLNGRTMIPLRFVAEALERDVEWQAESWTVLIRDKGPKAEPVELSPAVLEGKSLRTSHNEENYLEITIDDQIRVKGLEKNKEYRYANFLIRQENTNYKTRKTANIYNGSYETSMQIPSRDGEYILSLGYSKQEYSSYPLTINVNFLVENGKAKLKVFKELEDNLSFHNSRLEVTSNHLSTNYIRDLDQLKSLLRKIINEKDSDYEKAEKIVSWISENIYYDSEYYEGRSRRVATEPAEILESRCTICEGYANLTNALMRLAEIPSRKIIGYAVNGDPSEKYSQLSQLPSGLTNHAWNQVFVDGRWVIIDSTWNTSNVYRGGSFEKGIVRKVFFDTTFEYISQTHRFVREGR